jgi:acyl dehydratase
MDKPFHRICGDFHPGQTFDHWPCKTVTESDNNLFCLLTMNHNPLHLDAKYAAQTKHGRILVAGTYVFSLVVGMSVADLSGAAIANLEYENVIHHAPVFIGDTIRARSSVISVEPSSRKKDRGILTVDTEAFNQDNIRVLSLRRKVLLPRADKP